MSQENPSSDEPVTIQKSCEKYSILFKKCDMKTHNKEMLFNFYEESKLEDYNVKLDKGTYLYVNLYDIKVNLVSKIKRIINHFEMLPTYFFITIPVEYNVNKILLVKKEYTKKNYEYEENKKNDEYEEIKFRVFDILDQKKF